MENNNLNLAGNEIRGENIEVNNPPTQTPNLNPIPASDNPPIDPMSEVENNLDNNATPTHSRKSNKLLLAILGIGLFFLLLFSIATVIVLAAYEKISLPDKKIQEGLSYYVQNLSFMPKTPKYVILKSAEVHKDIGSAYTKISVSAKADEFKQIPGFGDTLEFLLEGPIDSSDPENPKLSWNIKLTRELDADFKIIDQNLYFRINKIPSMIYPLIGLNSSNFANNPLLNRWVAYDFSSLETDASSLLDSRGEDMTIDEVTEEKLLLIGDKLADKMVMTSETLDGVEVNKITLILTNQDMQVLEPEITDLLELKDTSMYENSYQSYSNAFTSMDNLEMVLWIQKDTYHLRRFDVAVDIHESAMNGYSQVLGIKTVANEESSAKKISMAMSASFSQLGESFEAEFTPPSSSITLDQYILEVSDFFTNQIYGSTTTPGVGEPGFSEEDLSGFEDAQIYSPPTGKSTPGFEGF